MFNLSGSEIIVILLLALVVLGPEKLPDAVRRAGRTFAELKRMGNSFQDEVRSAFDEPVREMRETADLLRESADLAGGATATGSSARSSSTRPASAGIAVPPEPVTVDGSDGEATLIQRTLAGESDPPSTPGTNPTP